MCGLAGFWSPAGFGGEKSHALLRGMTDRIQSRGPDSEGAWLDPAAGIALGHRRLSILELSSAGAQPMISDTQRYVLVFNGEIYNHLAVRAELPQGAPYRGHSDTETLLRAIDAWGFEGALQRCAGMFALACWDRQDRALILARDRMGEKPLYFGWQGSGASRSLLFGSELKALVCHPAFEREIDRAAVTGYLERLCVAGTRSIWKGIAKVRPGTIIRFSTDCPDGRENPFWSVAEAIAKGKAQPVDDAGEALELIHERLAEAVAGQLLSDVPLGAFLSGGIDSSLIVALMQQASGGRARTFSIGFEDESYNEADHARAVAAHLGTAHTDLIVSAAHTQEVIPRLPHIYDEPFADSSQIPTFLVSEMAHEHVTVALSGDGADELFGGYTRYTKALAAWDRLSALPRPLRQAGSAMARQVGSLIPARAARAAAVAGAADLEDFYARFTNHNLPQRPRRAGAIGHAALSHAEQLIAQDQVGYLPDDILVKVDRAAMAVSLEVRAPYLDHRVVEASWRIDSAIKRRRENGAVTGKWPLRQLLDRYVPRALTERPKHGFGIPVGAWLRGPLREWADDLLDPSRIARAGLVSPRFVTHAWRAHRDGVADKTETVWALVMLSAWHAEHGAT